MKHYEITLWSDYVRGLGGEDERAAMREHLEAGCAQCAEVLAALRAVVETAAVEREHAPPSHALRTVRAYLAITGQVRHGRGARVLEMAYDSDFSDPAVATRVQSGTGRQVRFESRDYSVDVRIDPPGDAGTAVVAGQCLDSKGDPVVGTPAVLMDGGEIASQGLTGEEGEFQLTTRSGSRLELWLLLAGGQNLTVPLASMSSGSVEDG